MTGREQWPAKRPPSGKGVNPEYVALWGPCLDEGMSISAVAEVFGVTRETVRRHYPGRGWTMDQARELGTFMRHHNQRMRKATFAK